MFPTSDDTFFLWNCVWQTTLCLTIGGLASAIWSHWPARAHRVLVLTIIACLTVPLCSQIVYHLGWGVLVVSTPIPVLPSETNKITGAPVPPVLSEPSAILEKPTGDGAILHSSSSTPTELASPVNSPDSQRMVNFSWEHSFYWIWGILSVFVLIRLMFSMIFEWFVLRSAQTQDNEDLQKAVDEAVKKLEINVAPKIFLSNRVRCPVICCWKKRPALLFPLPVVPFLASRDCVDLLCHELAHWKRQDHLTKLLSEVAVCLFPWQPMLWWAKKRLGQLSERACDDWVLACGHSPESYAESLLRLVPQMSSTLTLSAVSTRKKLQGRLASILNDKHHNPKTGRIWASGVIFAVVFLVAAIAFTRPKAASTGTEEGSQTATANPSPSTMSLRLIDKSHYQNPTFTSLSPISQDGKLMVYSRYQDLKIHEITTGTNRAIPDLAFSEEESIGSPVLSPDNTKLYYNKWNSKKNTYQLHVCGLDGSGDRNFYERKSIDEDDFYMIGLTPDNQKMLAVSVGSESNPNSQILLISIDDGTIQVVKNTGKQSPGNACMSLDGKSIAFDLPKSNNMADSDIYLIAVDGSSETPLFQSPANEKLLGWSPDGQWIFFSTNSSRGVDAYIQNMENGKPKGQPTLVKKDIGNLEPKGFTQDGSFYYVIKYTTGGIYQLRFDFQKGECLSPPNPLCMGVPPTDISWSPNGKYFAYYESNDTAGSQRQSLCIMPEETGETRRFALPSNDLYDLHWSPDSKSILSESWGSKGLYQVDVQTGKSEMLIKNASGNVQYAQYLPDGKHIVSYSAEIDLENFNRKNAWFAIRNLETGEENKIVSDPYLSWFFSVSPDGKWLAFSIDDPANREYGLLKVISIPDGETKVVWDKYPGQRFGYSPNLIWTTDNRSLLYLEGRNLMQISISGGEPRKLYQLDSAWSGKLTVHPDGQRIAFVEGGDIKEIWALENFLPQISNLMSIFSKERDSFLEVSQNPSLNPSLRITDQLVTDNFEDTAMEGWEMSTDPKQGPPFEHKVENGELVLVNSRACIGLKDWKNYRIKVRYCPQGVGVSMGGGNGIVFFRRNETDSYGFHCFPKVNMVQLVAGHQGPTGAPNVNVLNTAHDIHFELNHWYDLEMEIKRDHIKGYVDGQVVFDVIDDQSLYGSISFKANDRACFDDFHVELLPE